MPLNMNKVPSNGTRKQKALIPAGQSMCRLVQVIDLGLQEQRPYKGQEKPPAYEMLLMFEFPEERIEIDGESKPMWKSKRLKMSSDERSTCYKWYTKLDPDMEFGGDWSKLLGVDCAALITHEAGRGKNEGFTFDNIADLMPLMKGMSVPPLENPATLFDLTSPDMAVFESLPDWVQGIIKSNLEYDGSRLQSAVEGTPRNFTARAPGDAPTTTDSEYVTQDEVATSEPQTEDDPW